MSQAEAASLTIVESELESGPDDAVSEIQDLIARAQQGDRKAFEGLYRLHVDSVYRYLYYRCRDASTAEDLTAEVFVRVLRKIRTFEWRGVNFSAWLLRIAKNIFLDHVKSSGARMEIVGVPESTRQESAPGSDLEVLDRLDREAVRLALSKLRGDYQEVLYLRFLQGLSSLEVAEAMGKSEGAIRVLQFRALKQLLKALREDQGIDGR